MGDFSLELCTCKCKQFQHFHGYMSAPVMQFPSHFRTITVGRFFSFFARKFLFVRGSRVGLQHGIFPKKEKSLNRCSPKP